MKKMVLIAVCSISICCYSQRVAINTDGSAPHTSAILDVKSTNKGFLPPRIALTGSADVTTIAAPATGLLIYNTATAGNGPAAISPGYYYYTGTAWASLAAGPAAWLTTGTEAFPGDYLGTSNLENVVFKVNGVNAGLLDQYDGNTFWGYRSGLNNTGTLNTAIGANALQYNTYGNYNTAIGVNSLNSNATGENNTATGNGTLFSNITGTNNTAAGVAALYSNTTGNDNIAVGVSSLGSNTTGNGNTGIGSNALYSNTTGNNNTAIGSFALISNTTGENNTANGSNALQFNSTGNYNTANGLSALAANTSGISNTANGANALAFNTTGQYNTANGDHALYANSTGESNTANGISALLNNNTGSYNAANGSFALISNTTGNNNTAMGDQALRSSNAENNTAIGAGALYNNSIGNGNIALGMNAGNNLTTGDNNISIGNNAVAAESGTIRIGTDGTHLNTFIAGINGSTLASGIPVYIKADGQLGILTSSARFKENIEDMDNISDDLLKLRPVSFVYKDAVANGDKTIQYGLIAEEVAKINPALVMFDKDGKPYTVRYQMLTPMLVKELQKEHEVNKEQNEKIQSLQKQIDELKLLIGKSK